MPGKTHPVHQIHQPTMGLLRDTREEISIRYTTHNKYGRRWTPPLTFCMVLAGDKANVFPSPNTSAQFFWHIFIRFLKWYSLSGLKAWSQVMEKDHVTPIDCNMKHGRIQHAQTALTPKPDRSVHHIWATTLFFFI